MSLYEADREAATEAVQAAADVCHTE